MSIRLRIASHVRLAVILAILQSVCAWAADPSTGPIQHTHVTLPLQAPSQFSSVTARAVPRESAATAAPRTAPTPGLTIIPTFDTTITSDPNSATIQATINSAIATYANCFSDPVTVNITFKEMGSGLGQSNYSLNFYTYSNYRAALLTHATTADDTTALANVPSGSSDPTTTFSQILLTRANARALGLPAGSGGADGTVSLNTSICNLSPAATDPIKYSLFAVACHEIDEVLGTASNVNLAFAGSLWPADLFRYANPGTRSFTSSGAATSYFSIDGGTTNLAPYNQNSGGDYGDWLTSGAPKVQDAFATPGTAPLPGVELRLLDVIGYTRNFPVITPASLPSGNIGVAYNQTLTVTNCTPPYGTFTVTGFNAGGTGLPAPTTNSGAGTFTVAGTPVATGTVSFTVNVTDTYGASASQNYSFTVSPPPILNSISPTTTNAGSGSFTLTLTGSNFNSTSVVQWAGQPNLTPLTQTATQLTVTVPASYVASAGTPAITVFNSVPSGTSSPQTFTVIAILAINSGPTATPNPAGIGQTVQFSAGSNISGTTFTWNFGDGSPNASGATTSHTYAAAGAFTVTVTATNGIQTATGSVNVTVNGPLVGTGPNSTGSVFSDAFIAAFGTPPASFSSTPVPLLSAKLTIKLNFASQNGDSLTLSGAVAIPPSFKVSGTKLALALGGLTPVFTLDSKGKAKSGSGQAAVAIKSKKGVVAAQTSKLSVKLSKTSLAAGLAAFGLTNANATAKPVTLNGTVVFANALNAINLSEHYSAKQGKTGMCK